jgi:hypothetical protein
VIRESDKFVHYKRTDDNFITDIFLFHNWCFWDWRYVNPHYFFIICIYMVSFKRL